MPSLCWCRDRCKFFKSKHRLSMGIRYWACANYSCDYPDRRWDTSRYRQLVRAGSNMFPYHFSFKVRTNNLSRLPVVLGSAMWLPQVDRPRYPPTQAVDSRLSEVGCQKGPREEGGRAPHRRAQPAYPAIDAHLEAYRRKEHEKKKEMAAEAKAAGEKYNAELARKGTWPRSTQYSDSLRPYVSCISNYVKVCVYRPWFISMRAI